MNKKTEYIDLGESGRLNPNNLLNIFPPSGNSIVLENCFVCEELSWLKFDYTITARHTGTSFFRTIFAKNGRKQNGLDTRYISKNKNDLRNIKDQEGF